MIKICFLIAVLIIHAVNVLLLSIERKHVFQNRGLILDCFFQLIADKDDKLKLCDNSETLVEELFSESWSLWAQLKLDTG